MLDVFIFYYDKEMLVIWKGILYLFFNFYINEKYFIGIGLLGGFYICYYSYVYIYLLFILVYYVKKYRK